jgi:hypothetical protein
VTDALEARDAAVSPAIRRSDGAAPGGGSFGQVWPGINYRATVNDNMLVTVMIRDARRRAERRGDRRRPPASTSSFWATTTSRVSPGWQQNDPRYQDALIKVATRR